MRELGMFLAYAGMMSLVLLPVLKTGGWGWYLTYVTVCSLSAGVYRGVALGSRPGRVRGR